MAQHRIVLFSCLSILLVLGVATLSSQTPAENPQSTPEVKQVPPATATPADDSKTAPVPSESTSSPDQARERKVADPGEAKPDDHADHHDPADDHTIPLAPDVSRRFPLSSGLDTPRDPNAYRLTTNTDLVLLDVSVKDNDGGFVSGLKKENFRVFDNAKEMEIKYFESGDIPVSLGLIVDNSGSMRAKRAQVVTAALAFVTASNPRDELFVVNFNDGVRMGLPAKLPFTDDHQLLRGALLNNPTEGRTAMNDGLRAGLHHLQKGKFYKKALILVSDGGDNASQMTNEELFRLVQETQATIYTIGVYDDDDKDKNPGVLKKLASLTGGECYLPERLTDLVGICTRIAKDIRNRYSIGFIPDGATYTGKVHPLKVLATSPDRPKLAVRARTSYIPPAPAGAMSTRNTTHTASK